MTPIEELALRLHVGARAIREGRVKATYWELVEGAICSLHYENSLRTPPLRDLRKRRAKANRRISEHRKRQQRGWAAAGLCTRCGKREPMPGGRWCSLCVLHERVAAARRRGLVPHIRHPKPEEVKAS